MTFPSGAPGGFPGQVPQQPLQGPGYGPPRAGMKLGLPQIGHLVVAGLGLLVFFFGFIDAFDTESDGANFYGYQTSLAWVPALLFIGGMLSLKAVLPGEDKKPGLPPVVIVFAATWAYLFFVFNLGDQTPDLAAGGIMVMIFSILQMLVAIGAFLLDAGIVKLPQPNPYAHQQGGFPQTGTFQQAPPSSAFPQQPQPQQPPVQPGQQTTFAPQQGQFGQQQPGTPPGGYPQG